MSEGLGVDVDANYLRVLLDNGVHLALFDDKDDEITRCFLAKIYSERSFRVSHLIIPFVASSFGLSNVDDRQCTVYQVLCHSVSNIIKVSVDELLTLSNMTFKVAEQ